MKKQDFLDRIIEDRKKSDPAFSESWPMAELLIEIARIRKSAGLTQCQIAERMGVTQPRVAEIERDPTRVSFRRIMAYVQAAGADLTVSQTNSTSTGAAA